MNTMAVINVERKVTKIGNSWGVTLPQEVLKRLNIKHGDEVKFNFEDSGTVTIKKSTPIDENILEDFKHAFKNYDEAESKWQDYFRIPTNYDWVH